MRNEKCIVIKIKVADVKKVIDDVRLMIKICDMYYNQNVSQQQKY